MKSARRPVPPLAEKLLLENKASPRLRAHLEAVHDAALRLTEQVSAQWPSLVFNTEDVLFGAAVHDIGKIRHPEELSRPGHLHEDAGRPNAARKRNTRCVVALC